MSNFKKHLHELKTDAFDLTDGLKVDDTQKIGKN